jgi:fibronectin-binding autotransporter adhesin
MNTTKCAYGILVMAGLVGTNCALAQTWTGSGDMTWTQPDSNSFSSQYTSGSAVTFTNTGAGTVTIDAGGVTPGAVVVNSSADYTFTGGSIGGTGGLSKSGAGVLTLSAANNYSGTTTLSAGTLQLGNATSIGASTLAMASGTTLQLRNDSDTTFTAPIATPAGSVTYNFDVNNAGSAVTGKKLSLGNLTFAVNSTNQIIVTGGNSYTLGLGTLSHPSGSGGPWAFTVNATTAAVTINKFATGSYGTALTLQGGNPITLNTFELVSNGNNSLTVSGSGTVVTLGSTMTTGRNNSSPAYALNSGTLNLTTTTSLANVYTSGTATAPTFAINGGTLNNTSGSALTLAANSGLTAGSPTITLGGNFSFGTAGSTSTNNLNLGTGAIANAGNRTITFAGTGTTLTLGGTMNNTSGAIQTTTVNGAGNTLTLGGYTLGNNLTNVITGTGNVTITGAVSQAGGSSGLTYSGSAKLTLTGANTYGGLTTVNSGTLAVTGGGQLYSNAARDIANAITINSGSTIEFDNWNWGGSFGTLWYARGNIVINGGTMRYVGTTANGWAERSLTIGANGATLESATSGQKWTVASGGSYTTLASNGGALTLGGAGDGQIAQIIPGSGTVTKSGSGTWTLSGTNTYTGVTTINGGNLKLGATNVVGKTSQIVIGDGTLDASNITNKLPTLDVTTVNAKINLGVGGALQFADSHTIDWTGGKLTITGAFVNNSSIRFANSSGLTETQLAQIKITGFASTWIDSNGYLFGKKGTLVLFY